MKLVGYDFGDATEYPQDGDTLIQDLELLNPGPTRPLKLGNMTERENIQLLPS